MILVLGKKNRLRKQPDNSVITQAYAFITRLKMIRRTYVHLHALCALAPNPAMPVRCHQSRTCEAGVAREVARTGFLTPCTCQTTLKPTDNRIVHIYSGNEPETASYHGRTASRGPSLTASLAAASRPLMIRMKIQMIKIHIQNRNRRKNNLK